MIEGLSQEYNLQMIQGIWESVNLPGKTNNSYFVTVNKNFKYLSFEYDFDTKKSYIHEGYVGFQDSSFYDIDEICLTNLKESGVYYTEISSVDEHGRATKTHFNTTNIIEVTDGYMEINFGNINMFNRVYELSNWVLKTLYFQGKKNKRNYIKEYLDIQVIEITSDVCEVYSEPNKPTQRQLNKGDIVIVTEENEKWLKVEHGDDEKKSEGWIKRVDVK
ncbi:MAG: hypothetical protein LBL58_12850 [Tannerellaceae bacterium]|jgi:hypothetical protein|nr:hypothetical protein [Tannerellaceae bacterium]